MFCEDWCGWQHLGWALWCTSKVPFSEGLVDPAAENGIESSTSSGTDSVIGTLGHTPSWGSTWWLCDELSSSFLPFLLISHPAPRGYWSGVPWRKVPCLRLPGIACWVPMHCSPAYQLWWQFTEHVATDFLLSARNFPHLAIIISYEYSHVPMFWSTMKYIYDNGPLIL